jgi:hypothetical protein
MAYSQYGLYQEALEGISRVLGISNLSHYITLSKNARIHRLGEIEGLIHSLYARFIPASPSIPQLSNFIAFGRWLEQGNFPLLIRNKHIKQYSVIRIKTKASIEPSSKLYSRLRCHANMNQDLDVWLCPCQPTATHTITRSFLGQVFILESVADSCRG